MMQQLGKSTVLLIAVLLTTLNVYGQVIIEQEDIPTEPGILQPFFLTSDAGGIEVDIGNQGANQEWDFSAFISDSIVIDSLINPEEAPYADDFPDANRVYLPGGGGPGFGGLESYRYEMVADSGWYLDGFSADILGFLDFPIAFPDPLLLMPFPASMGDEWDVTTSFDYYYTADTLAFDTLRIEFVFGGFSETDAWGMVQYPGGQDQALRLFSSLSLVVNAYAIQWIFGQRIELPLGEWFHLDASYTYSWYAPGVGEIATITSMPLEEDPEFDTASSVRVRFLTPELQFPQDVVDFGEIIEGEPGLAEIPIENVGEGTGAILDVDFDPVIEDQFQVTDELPLLIAPDGDNQLHLEWIPSATGPMNGTVSIYHNDPDLENPYEITVQGTGLEAPHFDPVDPTEESYFIAVNEADFNNVPLQPGDEIGVFDGELCVGAIEVTAGFPVQLEAWQADPLNGRPGFTPGNMILFHYWIDQDGLELPAQAQFLQGDGSFGFGLFSAVILSAENGNPPEITIPIQANYFELVSFNLNPGTPSAEDFFCPQLPSLEIVYQNDGSILLCAMINTIGDIDFHQGYQVFCSEAEELTVTGAPIDLAETHYSLMDGRWNWLGHPYRVPVSVEDALAGIMDDLVIIQNDEGRFWIPGLVNTLGTMQPGDGYAVFVNQDLDFTYPDIQGVAGFTEDPLPTDQSALDISPTGLPYIVVFTTGEKLLQRSPARINIYDGDLLVGGGEFSDDADLHWAVSWMGDLDYDVPGAQSGHPVRIVVLDASGRVIPTVLGDGELSFGDGAYGRAFLELDESAVPSGFKVGEAYPNPFNSSTVLTFETAENTVVDLDIFNTLGQRIFSSSSRYEAGTHEVVLNSARIEKMESTGLYLVRFSNGRQTINRKILYLK